MNPNAQAASAYGNAAASTKSPRQVEYLAFARITKALTRTAQNPNDEKAAAVQNFADLAHALHENLRLWSIVQGDVSSSDNALPEQLRAGLFYLAEFTREHTKKVLKGEATSAPLVEINTAVMRGLHHEQASA